MSDYSASAASSGDVFGGAAAGASQASVGKSRASAGEKTVVRASAGSTAVSVAQVLQNPRAGADSRNSRGVKRSHDKNDDIVEAQGLERLRLDVLAHFNIRHPGKAIPIDPRTEYFLFSPNGDVRFALANPGSELAATTASYKVVEGLGGFTVGVKLKKRCFVIHDSPPPTSACSNKVQKDGCLTVGWRCDKNRAWLTVLEVLDQVRSSDLRPLALHANYVAGASAGTKDVPKRGRDLPESIGSVERAIEDVSEGRPWVSNIIKIVEVVSPVGCPQPPAQVYVDCDADRMGNYVDPHRERFAGLVKDVTEKRAQYKEDVTGRRATRARISPGARLLAGEEESSESDSDGMELFEDDMGVVSASDLGSLVAEMKSEGSGEVAKFSEVGERGATGSGEVGEEDDWDKLAAGEGRVFEGGVGTESGEVQQNGLRPETRVVTVAVALKDIKIVYCRDYGRCLGNCGRRHCGPVTLKSMHFGGRISKATVAVCTDTGEVINSSLLAEAYKLDPQMQVNVHHLQRICASAVPGYPLSSDDEEDDGSTGACPERVQPCTDAILAKLQPLSTRYSDVCKDYLLDCSPGFFKRYMFCLWANECEVNHHSKLTDAFHEFQANPSLGGPRPVTKCWVMEGRWARAKEQMLALREDCITSFHVNYLEHEWLALSLTRAKDINANAGPEWGTEEQRAILSAAKWSEAMVATRGFHLATGTSGPSVCPPLGTTSKAAPSKYPASPWRRAEAARKATALDARQWAHGVLQADLAGAPTADAEPAGPLETMD